MLSMFFSVFVLSVGAPGVPGAGLVCLSVLLTQLNVPLAGIGLVMGLDSLLGMMRAMSNSRILDRCKIKKRSLILTNI